MRSNTVTLILAGAFLLIIGAAVTFYLLKKKEISQVKKLYDDGTIEKGFEVYKGIKEIVADFSGKKSM